MSKRDWEGEFLAALAESPNVTAACAVAGITRAAAYLARAADPDFAERWTDALERSTDALVGEVYRRALAGSDRLAEFLLRSHRRDVYGDKVQTDLTTGGEKVQTVIYLPENHRGRSLDVDDQEGGDPAPAGPSD